MFVRKVQCAPHTKTQSIDKRITALALDFDFAYRNNNNPECRTSKNKSKFDIIKALIT